MYVLSILQLHVEYFVIILIPKISFSDELENNNSI